MLSMLWLFRFYDMYINLFKVVQIINAFTSRETVIENLILLYIIRIKMLKGLSPDESIKVVTQLKKGIVI